MIEVTASLENLAALFNSKIPNSPMLFSTLLGYTPGRVFVNDPISPSECIVITNEALVFASQGASQEFLDETLAYIKHFSHIALIWHSSTFALEIPKADKTLLRLEFTEFKSQSLTDGKNHLPDGFEFHQMDRDLLERCEWRAEIESYCGNLENFLEYGFGVCLMRGNEIISEAYAPFVGLQNIEIGVVTNEAERGHGYAAIACAALIQSCQERGFTPYWSCDADNAASLNLARKLGFQNEREYEIRMYRGTPK